MDYGTSEEFSSNQVEVSDIQPIVIQPTDISENDSDPHLGILDEAVEYTDHSEIQPTNTSEIDSDPQHGIIDGAV